ncbi:MAG TPA: MBL fold metallo-hydrolase [Cellulomonas sp.]
MQHVTPDILVETHHLGSNNAAVRTPEGVVLIDAPHLPSDAVRWRRTVEELGEVRYLVQTDHHIDHTMGNAFLPGTIVAHRLTRDGLVHHYPERDYIDALIARLDPAGSTLMAGHQVRLPAITFTDALDLTLGGTTLTLIAMSGHTPNTIVVLDTEAGVLFSGDDVCSASLPSFQEARVAEWLASLDRIDALDFDTLVPGHGELRDHRFVGEFRQWMLDLVGRVEDEVRRGTERDAVVAGVRYPDRIHGATEHWAVGYPDDIVESLQVRSIATIFDQVLSGELTAS